jgi:D-glycero-D-manno-heptose 1,7-bisphosphate phosphatase
MSKRRYVLLDRDGTLIAERHYLARVEDVELLPNTVAGLQRLTKLGLGLVVVTNQSGIARGYFGWPEVNAVHEYLRRLLADNGVSVAGFYVCPHGPDATCACRKPEPGLVLEAAREHDFDPGAAFVIGDKACDVDLGKRVGATTLLVRTGYGEEYAPNTNADHVVADVLAAADIIAACGLVISE